jgi:hypothetical protein
LRALIAAGSVNPFSATQGTRLETLMSFARKGGHAEFLLPSLRIGARLFLSPALGPASARTPAFGRMTPI